jgi:hypothetical protein
VNPAPNTNPVVDKQAADLIRCLRPNNMDDWEITRHKGFSLPDVSYVQVSSSSREYSLAVTIENGLALYEMTVQGNTAHIRFAGISGYSHQRDLLREGTYTLTCQSQTASLKSSGQELVLRFAA